MLHIVKERVAVTYKGKESGKEHKYVFTKKVKVSVLKMGFLWQSSD